MNNDDVLSDVFTTLRVDSDLYFRAELRGDAAVALPRERRRIRFHLVRAGRCRVAVDGAGPVELTEGDLAVVPDGAGETLSAGDGPATPLGAILAAGGLADGVLRHGAGDGGARLLCGFCQLDPALDHPVTASLPPLLAVRLRDLGAEPWAAATLRLLALEADLDGQGGRAVLGRLLEIVLVQAMRRLVPADGPAGFVAALSDRALSRALAAMHRRPEAAWTLDGLAREAGMSRARFADRFAATVGQPAIAYLTAWRLARARLLLATTGLDMAEIAERCGYASVPSFSIRFRKSFGLGPGAFRRAARAGGTARV